MEERARVCVCVRMCARIGQEGVRCSELRRVGGSVLLVPCVLAFSSAICRPRFCQCQAHTAALLSSTCRHRAPARAPPTAQAWTQP